LLVMFGTQVSPQIPLGGFHSQVGWLGFIAVALGMVAVTRRMPFFATQTNFTAKVENKDKVKAADKVEGINPILS